MRKRGPGFVAIVHVATLLAAVSSPSPAACSSGRDIEVSVQRSSEGYSIEGRFTSPATPEQAWKVLTDYEAIPSFVGSMRTSRVLRRSDGFVYLLQKSSAGALFFRRTISLLLKVREAAPREIDFTDLSGKSFRTYEGSWRLSPRTTGVGVVYRLRADGGSIDGHWFSGFAAKWVASSLLEGVCDEMRRQAAGH